jgi:hypothetical protein
MKNLKKQTKVSLFTLIALHIPIRYEFHDEDVINENSWMMTCLRGFCYHLDIDISHIDCVLPLLKISNESEFNTSKSEKLAIIKSLIEVIEKEVYLNYYLLSNLFLFLVLNNLYDARGRITIQNLSNYILTPKSDLVSLEYHTAHLILHYANSTDSSMKNTSASTKRNSQIYRYMQIGAVSLVAGTVVAVTGGLAAPAVAAALIGMGSSTLAASLSVGVMATLFGSAGNIVMNDIGIYFSINSWLLNDLSFNLIIIIFFSCFNP